MKSPVIDGPISGDTLLEAESALIRAAAQGSLRQVVREALAPDAWTLTPGPTIAALAYAVSVPDAALPAGPLTLVLLASSGDLGVTCGPSAGGQAGHFVRLWSRMQPGWRIAVAASVRHDPLPAPSFEASEPARGELPTVPFEDGVAGDFQAVAGREGLGAALRTYARNEGFLLLINGQPPLPLKSAEQRVRTQLVKDAWHEMTRGISADTSLAYTLGGLGAGGYLQLWQYDSQTANWGLRLLLLSGAADV